MVARQTHRQLSQITGIGGDVRWRAEWLRVLRSEHEIVHRQRGDIGRPRFRWWVCDADVNDEIRSLSEATGGFTGQLVRKAPFLTPDKQTGR